MSFLVPTSQIPRAFASWDDDLGAPRLSRRASLLIAFAAAVVAYGLTFGVASLAWGVLASG